MPEITAVPRRPAAAIARALNIAAAAVAAHGVLLWLADLMQGVFPRALHMAGELLLWVLAVPALVLTRPFTPLLWKLGLMNAPGWFAWPREALNKSRRARSRRKRDDLSANVSQPVLDAPARNLVGKAPVFVRALRDDAFPGDLRCCRTRQAVQACLGSGA